MNRFNQIYYYAAVVIVFEFACHMAHGININPDDYHRESLADLEEQCIPDPYHTEYFKVIDVLDLFRSKRKRGFFWSDDDDDDDDDKETIASTTSSTTGSTTGSTAGSATVFTTVSTTATGMGVTPKDVEGSGADQLQDVMKIVIIGDDVEKSLVVAAPYLPLVHKVATYFVPNLSPYKVVTLSLNMAALTTQASQNYDEGGRNLKSTVSAEVASCKTPAKESSEVPQTVPEACATFGDYATDIYGKLKDAFESHFGPVPKLFVDGETTESSPEQTDGIFDKVESKMYTVHNNGINGYDASDTENDEHKIETTVTKTCTGGCQPPNSDTMVTKTYESGAETVHQSTNGETNHVQIATKLIEDGMTVGTQVTKIKNEMNSSESSSNESNDSDDEIENIIELLYDVEIKEDDFNRVKQESMGLQPDFVQTLSGEELLKHIDELQNSLPNSNINSKNVFMGLIDRLDIDEDVDDDKIDGLVDALVKTTNYFISSALEKKTLFTTPPMC